MRQRFSLLGGGAFRAEVMLESVHDFARMIGTKEIVSWTAPTCLDLDNLISCSFVLLSAGETSCLTAPSKE